MAFLSRRGSGRLPGDIVFESDGMTVYAPIAPMVLVSIVLAMPFRLSGR